MDKKMTRYEDWKNLEPLTDPVPKGTMCVCLVDFAYLKAGDVITTLEHLEIFTWCTNGITNHVVKIEQIALLPAEASGPAPQSKQERKIIHTSCAWAFTEMTETVKTYFGGALETIATCNDGTAWHHSSDSGKWTRLPPIPQDGE